MKTDAPIVLRTNLGASPVTAALREGRVTSDRVLLQIDGPANVTDGFKPMIQAGAFDAGELPIVTFLQAKSADLPFMLLPVVLAARPPHCAIVHSAALGNLQPKDIEGLRIGVRSYAQTTAVWARGVLMHDYGVDLSKVTWITCEDGHVPNCLEPPHVERAPPGMNLLSLLATNAIEGAILGGPVPQEAALKPLIPDAAEAGRSWVEKHGFTPINHVFVINRAAVSRDPEIPAAVYDLFLQSRSRMPGPGADPTTKFGVEANRRALETIVRYAREQNIIPGPIAVNDLFDERRFATETGEI